MSVPGVMGAFAGAAAEVMAPPQIDLEAGDGMTDTQRSLQHLDEIADAMEQPVFCGLTTHEDLAKWERGSRTVMVVILVGGIVLGVLSSNWWLVGGSLGAGCLAGPTLYRAYEFTDLLGTLTHIGAIRATGRELEGQVDELGGQVESLARTAGLMNAVYKKQRGTIHRLEKLEAGMKGFIADLKNIVATARHTQEGSAAFNAVAAELERAQAHIIELEAQLKAAHA